MPSDTQPDSGGIRLRHDPDFQRELDSLTGRTKAGARSSDRWRWIFSALALVATILILHTADVTDGLMVASTIAVSALLLIIYVNRGLSDLHLTLTVLIATTEWIGKKQLGETEEIHQP